MSENTNNVDLSIEETTEPQITKLITGRKLHRIYPNHAVNIQHDGDYSSLNANPCLTGVTIDHDGTASLFHSDGGFLQYPILLNIQNSRRAIIGGGLETLNKYHYLLNKWTQLEVITPQSEHENFNIFVIDNKIHYLYLPHDF